MSCSSCAKTKPILSCVTELTVGTVANLTTALYIYIRNNTTNRLYRFEETSSGAGLVVVTLDEVQMIPGHNYELWVTLASATNIEQKLDVTIGDETNDCFDVSFQRVFNTDNSLRSGAQTLTIAE